MVQNLEATSASRNTNSSGMTNNGGQVNAYDIANSDQWSAYTKYRPKYPPQLFKRLYDYHAATGGNFDTAHDAGCGPGVTAAILAQKFKHIICSDFSKKAIESARHNLTSSSATASAATYQFQVSSAEDMSWLDPASVDMVTMTECIHWTDTAKTVEAVARVLRSGGTFATWYYSDARYPDNEAAQTIFNEVNQHWVKLRAEWSKESERTLWTENSGYDCIGFPESQGWAKGVKRIKFNTNRDNSVWERVHNRRSMKFPSQIGDHDILEFVEGAKEWELQANADWFRGWFESLQPEFEPGFLEPYMEKMQDALGGPEATTRAVFPVVLIMAKKQ